MPNTFDWVEIRTHDIEGAARFYGALFGWKITNKENADGTDVWIFDTGGAPRIENLRRGGIWMRPKGEPVGISVYVVVEHINETLDRVVKFGGKVISPKAPLGEGYGASFEDPDGNLLRLYQDKEQVAEDAK